ncbi:MAG: Gfo/Idh/MocA family oxidoreductase [Verrucomicrobia bacterium]|nr:Gfo/Idh/MocA family oxidoreductase [Verrucomicrobiota bacterium]
MKNNTHSTQNCILLIGAGRWGINHLRTWLTLGVNLYVADAGEKILNRCREMGVPADRLSNNHREFLPRVEAVDICTPAETHYPLCCEAMDLGKDVFVEKPMTLTHRDSEDLVKRAHEKKRILQVGHIFRYEPPSQFAKKLIDARLIGDVKWLRGNFSGFKRPRSDSGVTMADAIHFVDLFNYLLGRLPTSVNAHLLDVLGRGMDDNAWLWLDYEGVFGTIEVGYFSPLKKREVLIVGAEKSVVIDYTVQQDKVKIHANQHRRENGEWKAIEGEVHTTEFDPEEPLLIELRAFLSSLRTRAAPLADGSCGAHAVRVVEAIFESNRLGRPVRLGGEG